ncbi:MAG: baseplate J/gp47 family protein [Candidatus Pacebacteria bacterium]|nr:baseplate J/gp47 family protein [Candidatus Paceibacterota bacterium]
MALNIPTKRSEIFNKLSADVQSELPETNPQQEQSWLKAILSGIAGAFFDLYYQVTRAIDAFFADTTYGTYLEQKATNYGITRNPATISTGNIVLSGVDTTSIPIGTLLTSQIGNVYETLGTVTIDERIFSITLLTYASGIATVVTSGDHDLGSGIDIVIAGATPTGLNGTQTVLAIVNENTFTFTTTVSGSGTATGTITATSTTALAEIESQDTGLDLNLNGDQLLTLSTPISGIDNNARVTNDGISGGTDIESDESIRDRLVFRLQNPVTLFNAAHIELEAKKVNLVERVFVFNITPAVGQVTFYILKEDNGIPDAGDLALVKAQIVDNILPANTDESDLFVSAPTPVSVDFELTAIVPNTATMKLSIQNRLTEFFESGTTVGEDVTENKFTSIIQTTVDTETGELLTSFTINSPSADVTIASGEIALLGSVSFV